MGLMHLLFWLAAVGVVALAAAWLMLAATGAGIVLRWSHQEIVATRSFILVRRYGLWRGFLKWTWLILTRRLHRAGKSKPRAWCIAMAFLVLFLGFGAASSLPAVVNFLIPKADSSGILDRALGQTYVVDGILGALITTYVWLRGLSYVARTRISLSKSTREFLPAEFGRESRDHLAINMYWHSHVKTAVMFAAVYPWSYLLIVFGDLNIRLSPSGPVPPTSSTSEIFLSTLIFAAALLPSIIPAMAISRIVERRMVSVQVSAEILSLLEIMAKGEADSQDDFRGLIIDPLGSQRSDLAHVSDYLSNAAKEFDARQVHGFSPHPIATLLRAVSNSIHQFLRNARSLTAAIPTDLADTLAITLALLSARHDLTVYERLARMVSAFDEDGGPAVDLIEKPPGRFRIFASRALTGIRGMAVVLTSIATMAAIVLALLLFLRHKMNVNELLPYLR